ncbi:hypothetical protein [Psychroserpens sp. NJDZ02]|uniref:hypothetical protein n=1 Tax=Psychroserpens sp. NJDZ02 TaxID=2570561 RepID=UPI0010A7DB09|nr:hypothetical protein [Psychroserpens sp. NJDZ02]
MKIKKFLKKNKIYFNVLTTLLLGLMAIIVSYNSNVIANEQKQMSYYENTPDFNLSQEIKRDSTGYIREIAVKVSKFGGKAKNISIRIKSYAHFEIIDQQNNKLNKYIHLTGCFNESYRTGENKGDIRLLKGFDNNIKFDEFTRVMSTELIKNGYTPLLINPLFIIRINYTDFLNNKKEEYYDVSFVDGVLIEKSDFKVELFENKKLSSQSIPITNLDAFKLESYLKIIVNKNNDANNLDI